mmetsp:Transcript_32400/g.48117  ORF Transcript_32400/g.48117 Transcript_32400/m.48117 type:complete len:128 (-) Transcript_32400:289-672(-)
MNHEPFITLRDGFGLLHTRSPSLSPVFSCKHSLASIKVNILVPFVLWLCKMLFTPKCIFETITGARSACASVQTTKSDNIMFALQPKDKCSLKPGIDHIGIDGEVIHTNQRNDEYAFILLTVVAFCH